MRVRSRSVGWVAVLGASVMFLLTMSLPAPASVNWQTVAAGPNATETFENAMNWSATDYDPLPSLGPEQTPPGSNSTWFIEGAENDPDTPEDDSRPSFDGTIFLTQDRDGSDANHPKLGAGAIGGGLSNEVTTLVISANVTITGDERAANGELSSTIRQMRVGQQDWIDDEVFPWGIVKQTSGHVNIEMERSTGRGDLLLSNDKLVSAGGIWEVGGTASLRIATDVHIGEKGGVKSPGAIFRVRGSNAGLISIGDRFMLRSFTATWDVGEVDLGAGYRHQFNRGKAVVEFVLDANGVTPITVLDNLDIGSNATVTTPNLGTLTAIQPGFLRVKLSEPTTKGSGTYNSMDPGSGDVIVLFNSDRITSAITTVPTGAEELLEGRFFEPDHTNDAGTSPHRALLDGFRINSDYAGAVYSWQINYFETPGPAVDLTPAVILSGLQITGTPGDLNNDTMLTDADRMTLQAAIAAPPVSRYDLLNAPQHLFDLNADGVIDNLDLVTFNTHFLAPAGLAGDYNDDGWVDAADYTVWRDHFGDANESALNGNGDGMNGVDAGDYTHWVNNFGSHNGAGSLGVGVAGVPEPSAMLLAAVAVFGLAGVRRRQRVAA